MNGIIFFMVFINKFKVLRDNFSSSSITRFCCAIDEKSNEKEKRDGNSACVYELYLSCHVKSTYDFTILDPDQSKIDKIKKM